MGPRLLRFLGGSEFGVVSTLFFAALYSWPFLTFDKPGATFRFIFAIWVLHIAVIAASNFAASRASRTQSGPDADSPTDGTE